MILPKLVLVHRKRLFNTIKAGDTLTSIAQKHGLTVDQLAKLNNLKDTSKVNIGQTLKLK